MRKQPQLILTWVSWSWKTTVMNNLLSHYPEFYSRPIQFTTRKPRFENEHDDYVFLTHEQFMRKLINWDFMEYIEYNKELYWISKYFDNTKTNIFIVEPVWREAIKRHFKMNNIPYVSVFLQINEANLRYRLDKRGSSTNDIEDRVRDFKYFYPSDWDSVVDWDYNEGAVRIEINNLIKWASLRT